MEFDRNLKFMYNPVMTSVMRLSILLLMLLTAGEVLADAEAESNNTAGTANTLTSGVSGFCIRSINRPEFISDKREGHLLNTEHRLRNHL